MPIVQVFQMELVDSEWRSLAYGATAMSMGFGFGSMSLASGYIITTGGYSAFFLAGAGIELVAAGILLWILKRKSGVRNVSPT